MADLGALTQAETEIFQHRYIAFWRHHTTTQDQINPNVTDTITVTVNLDSTPQANVSVALYYRPNNALIATTKTNASGQATFVGLDTTDTSNYFAIAHVNGTLNALVYSLL